MTEIFHEVDEDLRREQLRKVWDRYSIFIIGGALLVVAAVAGWRGYQYLDGQRAAKAGSAFEAAVALSEQNKHTEAEAAFAKLATDAPAGYRVLARLRAAAEASVQDPQAAIKLFDAIGSDSGVAQPEQDWPGSALPRCWWTPRPMMRFANASSR